MNCDNWFKSGSKVNLTWVGVVLAVGLTQLFFTRKQKLKSNQGKTFEKKKKLSKTGTNRSLTLYGQKENKMKIK